MKIEDRILKDEKRAKEKSLALQTKIENSISFINKYIETVSHLYSSIEGEMSDNYFALLRTHTDLERINLSLMVLKDDMKSSMPKLVIGWIDFLEKYSDIIPVLNIIESFPPLKSLENQANKLEISIFEILLTFKKDTFSLSYLTNKLFKN
jgi:hypothetical protein